MKTAGWIAAALAAALVLWFYNGAVRLRNKAREAFSGIDVQLARRHDLVPALVRTVRAYASHEREALEAVVERRTRAQAAATTDERSATEDALRRSLDSLLVLVERYPELKADENFRKLHDQLVEVEDHLQYARRYYNGAVRDYNTRIQQVPGRFLAPLFRFSPLSFFQVEDASERAAPAVGGV